MRHPARGVDLWQWLGKLYDDDVQFDSNLLLRFWLQPVHGGHHPDVDLRGERSVEQFGTHLPWRFWLDVFRKPELHIGCDLLQRLQRELRRYSAAGG